MFVPFPFGFVCTELTSELEIVKKRASILSKVKEANRTMNIPIIHPITFVNSLVLNDN